MSKRNSEAQTAAQQAKALADAQKAYARNQTNTANRYNGANDNNVIGRVMGTMGQAANTVTTGVRRLMGG